MKAEELRQSVRFSAGGLWRLRLAAQITGAIYKTTKRYSKLILKRITRGSTP